MIGKTIAHYRVTAKLGAGGMGEVYRAADVQLGRDVALKILRTESLMDPDARQRLIREARSAAALNHPNICTVHEVGESDGQTFIVMELVEGRPLSDLIPKAGMPAGDVLRYGQQIAGALTHAHQRGLIHRDLKPANVVITPQGHAKVLDFGLAKRQLAVEENAQTESLQTLTAPGTTVGTLAYMAPEQLQGAAASEQSDVWSFGVMLFEMACGHRPFRGRTSFELSAAILGPSSRSLPATVPAQLRAVINRCLAREPAMRYARGGEVSAALEALPSGEGMALPSPRSLRLPGRKPLLIAAAGVVVVAMLTLLWSNRNFRTRSPQIHSVAVLPLENLSGSAEQDYLAAGVQEALTLDLAKLSGLERVVPRAALAQYAKSQKPLSQIANELGVDALITGSVLRSGNRVQISAHLINPVTSAEIWGDRLDRELRDLLTLQNEVVLAITRGIRLKLTASEQQELSRARPVNPEAYEAYLKGRFNLNKFTAEGFERGLAYLRESVEKDSGNAAAHGQLAIAYAMIGHETIPDAFVQAKAAARRALELDPNCAEALEVLAESTLYADWQDWPTAEVNFKKAISLNPNLAIARRNYSWYLNLMGRAREGVEEVRRATEIDPSTPLYQMDLGWQFWDLRESEKAIEHARKALDLDPNFPLAHLLLALVHSEAQRHTEAIAAAQKAAQIEPGFQFGLGMAYARAGRKDLALRIAAEIKKQPSPWGDFGLAELYATLGNQEGALHWLEQGFANRFSLMPYFKCEDSGLQRPFKQLRSHPRYLDLLRRMNLS